jgi:hypothetical protein
MPSLSLGQGQYVIFCLKLHHTYSYLRIFQRSLCTGKYSERCERRQLGRTTELSFGTIVDATIGENLRSKLRVYQSTHMLPLVDIHLGIQSRYDSSGFSSLVNIVSEQSISCDYSTEWR